MASSLVELFVMAVFRETSGPQDCNGLDCFLPCGGSDIGGNSQSGPVKDSSSISKRDPTFFFPRPCYSSNSYVCAFTAKLS
jgi:hypothetical protein